MINLNYIHILVAALFHFIIGALWYSLIFRKPRDETCRSLQVKYQMMQKKKEMPIMFAITFVLNFIIAFGNRPHYLCQEPASTV